MKPNNQITLIDRFRAVFLLHALGDTIGFKNGDWEFNYFEKDKRSTLDYVNELIYEFIALGGVNGINLNGWHISDDTFLHIAIGKALAKHKNDDDSDKLIDDTRKYMGRETKRMWKEANGSYINDNGLKIKVNRHIGITTSYYIKQYIFGDGKDARDVPYDQKGGGNGAAMRTPVIGLCFSSREQYDMINLMAYSITSSRITHNNALGYLAGYTIALMISFALLNIPIKFWPYLITKHIKSNVVRDYLKEINATSRDDVYDQITYCRYWAKYIDTKFTKDKEPIKAKAFTNPMHRMRYFYDTFHKGSDADQVGASGFLCAIMAYDALLDCDGYWEKLVVYAILHSGDSDTVGAVAGALYGSVYGLGDVPPHMLDYLERKNELEKLAKKLYKKYGLSREPIINSQNNISSYDDLHNIYDKLLK